MHYVESNLCVADPVLVSQREKMNKLNPCYKYVYVNVFICFFSELDTHLGTLPSLSSWAQNYAVFYIYISLSLKYKRSVKPDQAGLQS